MAKIDTNFVVPRQLQSGGAGTVDTNFVVPKDLQAGAQRDDFVNTVATGPEKAVGGPYNLTNHGGAVLDKPAIGNIYIGDYWKTGQGAADAQENDAAAVDFGNSKMMDVAAQYGAGKTSFIGSTVVGGPSPARFTESDIQSAVKTALANGSIQKNAQGMYTVVLPPGSILDAGGGVDSTQGLGGFHGSYDDGTGNPVYYAAIAYSDDKGNGINFDGNSQHAVNITESHEWMEAMTDPDVNSTIPGRGLAWYDDNSGEIGDLMMPQELQAGRPISQSFEQDAGGFMQQMEWSNKDKQFEIDAPGGGGGGGGTSDVTGNSSPDLSFRGGRSTSDTITLGDGANISDMKVSVDLTHRNVNGVSVTLTSPAGTSVTVPLRAGRHETGTFDLSAFNGESTQGDWKLTVNDSSRRDSGTLASWSLDAAVDAPATSAAGGTGGSSDSAPVDQ